MPLWTAGVLSGAVWNTANASAIYGIQGMGYAVSYSLIQCASVVSGIWGIFLFKEIKGAAVVVFFVSTAVLVAGALLLAVNG